MVLSRAMQETSSARKQPQHPIYHPDNRKKEEEKKTQ